MLCLVFIRCVLGQRGEFFFDDVFYEGVYEDFLKDWNLDDIRAN